MVNWWKKLKGDDKAFAIFVVFLILFTSISFFVSSKRFSSLKKNKGYTFGTVIKVKTTRHNFTRYEYVVGQKTYTGQMVGYQSFKLHDTVLVVYDTTAPHSSIAPKYPNKIMVDNNRKLIALDTALVRLALKNYSMGN